MYGRKRLEELARWVVLQDVRRDLLQDGIVVVHVQGQDVRKRSVLQAKALGQIAIPLLVLCIRRRKSSARESFLRCVECIYHVARDLAESAEVFKEQSWATGLLCAWTTGEIRILVWLPRLFIDASVDCWSGHICCASWKLRESADTDGEHSVRGQYGVFFILLPWVVDSYVSRLKIPQNVILRTSKSDALRPVPITDRCRPSSNAMRAHRPVY